MEEVLWGLTGRVVEKQIAKLYSIHTVYNYAHFQSI